MLELFTGYLLGKISTQFPYRFNRKHFEPVLIFLLRIILVMLRQFRISLKNFRSLKNLNPVFCLFLFEPSNIRVFLFFRVLCWGLES